ncbi:MAG TPA: sn-glycerol-3-phosphate ABC transporter ATP-binding protein UgpC [Haploplasma sp.]|nr:sn-glycerol-3-phosphate ABC transporter ATP-binding protein UgpC [Haploplasma sp.]
MQTKNNLIEKVEAGNLIFRGMKKVYPNGVEAVKDFNLEVEPGEFIVLVGPSGCGKSTTIRMIAGLEEISGGELLINVDTENDDGTITSVEKVLNNVAPKDRDISMVFQNYALYAHMTVYHNMAFSLMIRKENEDVIHEKVMKAARILGMEDYLNRKPAQLSGGQRQRVAIGRAIVRDPKIFLLDEPLSNLDAKLRGQMRKELKELQAALGATMLYVTHDQIEAITLADRIVIMDKGIIKQVGTPVEVYTDPDNLFVANFIGMPAMNVFKVRILENGEVLLREEVKENGKVVSKQTTINVEDHPAYNNLKQNYLGKEIYLGIRPENIIVKRLVDNDSMYQSTIQLYELLGSESLVHIDLMGQNVVSKIKDFERLNVGDKVEYKFLTEHLFFFDNETEERVR